MPSSPAVLRSTCAICSIEGRPKSKRWQRSTTVGSTFCASVVASTKISTRGWLLERLEERVPGLLGEHVGLIEDVHLVPPRNGRVRDLLPEIADVVDRVVRGR